MGIFDIFSNDDAQAAANDQIAGINTGVQQATGNINSGINSLNTNYTAALSPFLNLSSTAAGGTSALGNLLGLNGAAGTTTAMQQLQATPGYQFQLQQGNNAINAAAAANGTLNSGNQLTALSNYNQGLAGTTYQNAVNNLMPYLSMANSASSGIGGVYTGLGNQLAGQYDSLANLNYTAQTGIGNANANAEMANYGASANSLGALTGIASSVASLFSDERLKEDIAPVGKLYDGQQVYKYRYLNDPVWHIGLMAQEVEQGAPDAVTEIGGYKAVNYDKATDVAAALGAFMDDKVVKLDDRRAPTPSSVDLSRFLEAA